MYFKQKLGMVGEDIACQYLIDNKYSIIERNFRCRQGEIDIIAKDNNKNELVFFEVKTRSNLKYGRAVEAVHKEKQKHIYCVVKYYIYKNKINEVPIRIDVIEVYIKDEKYKLNHIKQITM